MPQSFARTEETQKIFPAPGVIKSNALLFVNAQGAVKKYGARSLAGTLYHLSAMY